MDVLHVSRTEAKVHGLLRNVNDILLIVRRKECKVLGRVLG